MQVKIQKQRVYILYMTCYNFLCTTIFNKFEAY